MADRSEEPKARELLRVVTGSPVRLAILDALAEGACEDTELYDRLDAPRSTVHVNLDALTSAGLVEQAGGRRRLTTRGDGMHAVASDALADVEGIDRLQPFLEYAPIEELDLRVLRDGALVRNAPNRPHAVINRYMELFEQASDVRGVTPYVVPSVVETAHEQVVAGELSFDIVFTPETMRFIEAEFEDELREHLECGRGVHHVYDGEIPFTLFLFDSVATLSVRDSDGMVRTLVELDDQAGIDWAERTYRAYRSEARTFTPEDYE